MFRSLDEARAAHPHLGFALYAYEPGEPVTLEIVDPEGVSTLHHGATEEQALAAAFPARAPEPEVSIFD